MKSPFRFPPLCLAVLSLVATVRSQDSAAEPVFSSTTVDIGIVASDLEASAKFYTAALGLTETKGFTATPEKATAFGLTNHLGADIRVFVLGEGAAATRIKLMSFPTAGGAKPDQTYIHSTVGISYLTLRVTDMKAALQRLEAAKVALLGETPASLGGDNYLVAVKDPDGNFIELIGPMKAE